MIIMLTMKHIKLTAIVLLCGMALSCGDAIEIPSVPEPDGNGNGPWEEETGPLSGDVVFTGIIEATGGVSWKKGDMISLSDGSSVVSIANTADDGPVAKFPATIKGKPGEVFAVSPASGNIRVDGNSVSLEIPANQSLESPAPAFRVARSSGRTLLFRNLLAKVSLDVDFDNATSIVLSAAGGEGIAGAATVDYSGEDPELSASGSTVTLSGNFAKGDKVWFTVCPGTLSSYTITAFSGNDPVAVTSGENLVTEAGKTTDLGTLAQEPPVYRIDKIWLWGGTGPEYNCTKVYDLYTKASSFNNDDGRGIMALKDNYLEFHNDGTFRNWAGEDGRNWWFVFTYSGNNVDCKQFYDFLPRSEGSFSLTGSSMTFTKPDGSTATATVVPAGTYPMPGTSPEKTVTIENQALMFTISGGKDNWDSAASDLDVIASHPRVIFFELVAMPAGFKVPEAAKTTDADFEYKPPVSPGGDFDLTTLPGTWTVYGGNSAPYGILVFGGSGTDPGFVSPIDKSWDWNGSVKYESDNNLIIKVTAMSGTSVSGTVEWTGGADGKFWDYVWLKTGEDLSRFYDKIPKGENPFSIDMSTMTATLSNGEKPKLLGPGVHTFSYGKSTTVPDGCFALDFHIMDPIPKTPDMYTDVDRFINAPLEYIIIFEKP